MIKRGQKIPKELIDSVKDIDLLMYLEMRGETFKKEGCYYRHIEHDSLVIKGNSFAWNSRGEKGYGAIKFNQIFYGMSFRESVQTLLEMNADLLSPLPCNRETRKECKKPFRYPIEQEVTDTKAIEEYLINERKIESRFVKSCIEKGLIAQDKRKNVVFKWIDRNGQIIGAEKQGTVPTKYGKNTYKYIFPNEVQHVGFYFDIGTPEAIYFFESPIDALSYLSIHPNLKNVRLQSLSGVKPKTLLKSVKTAHEDEKLSIKKIVVCVDNDKAGRQFKDYIQSITKEGLFESDLPKEEGLDWNNVLQAQKEQQSKEQSR